MKDQPNFEVDHMEARALPVRCENCVMIVAELAVTLEWMFWGCGCENFMEGNRVQESVSIVRVPS